MELNIEKVRGEIISQKEFSKKKNDVSFSALDYAMDNDLIDFVRIGNVRYIVLTEKSNNYKPKTDKK